MTKLSVNINKFATLRNARGGNNPDLLQVARDCEQFGGQGITIHPRPDERHIRRSDVLELKDHINTELNIEGYPTEDFINLVCAVKPAQVTLVPDTPEQLTSNSGWNTKEKAEFLLPIISHFHEANIRVSIFIDPQKEMADNALRCGADRVELYTEPYARQYRVDRKKAVTPYVECALHCQKIGLGINAGHDLSLENLAYFSEQIPFLDEVSIGHALVCDALYLGLEKTIESYLKCLSTSGN
ncbi:pyridoxine 5'-phosphate synthase [Alloprevotella sp. oral taxon 473]|uniref:pyridoxine 5'-phosphate synthase n=1 Tax=Alloprevotella sp. oral taxon 473 TaxID=712469 RepID=UPI0002A3ADB8|nr:pyridoxine 5'-phosphate synthase [Alloprevotella sp. oral taxon 473]EKX88706.1 pyridoxine 5'-phosphate synthase [Alloprevotella sp. oral taxon 473 str. F0040]